MIAAYSTGSEDIRNKHTWYAVLGDSEYWWFDQTGEFHSSQLAGNRLADGRYDMVGISGSASNPWSTASCGVTAHF